MILDYVLFFLCCQELEDLQTVRDIMEMSHISGSGVDKMHFKKFWTWGFHWWLESKAQETIV